MNDRVSISQTRVARAPTVLKAHGLGSCVAVALHSGVDFGLSMPANAVTFAIMLGAAAAVPLRSDNEDAYERENV